MASIPAYSVVLWEFNGTYSPGSIVQSPPVPAGYVWVVRDVAAYNASAPSQAAVQRFSFAVNGFQVWDTPAGATVSSEPYEASDRRWVAAAGELLSFISYAPGWSVRASGYQLSA